MKRRLWTATVVASGTLGLALLAWPLVGGAYAASVRAGYQMLFFLVGLDEVGFFANSRQSEGCDIAITVGENGVLSWACGMDSYFMCFVPTALFLALWLGTRAALPVPRRTLAWGLLLLHALFLARIGAIMLWHFVLHAEETPAHDHAGLWLTEPAKFLVRASYRASGQLTLGALLPLVIWAAVCARAVAATSVLRRIARA